MSSAPCRPIAIVSRDRRQPSRHKCCASRSLRKGIRHTVLLPRSTRKGIRLRCSLRGGSQRCLLARACGARGRWRALTGDCGPAGVGGDGPPASPALAAGAGRGGGRAGGGNPSGGGWRGRGAREGEPVSTREGRLDRMGARLEGREPRRRWREPGSEGGARGGCEKTSGVGGRWGLWGARLGSLGDRVGAEGRGGTDWAVSQGGKTNAAFAKIVAAAG